MLDYLCAADNSDSNRFARINGPYRTDTERAAIAQLFSLELFFFFNAGVPSGKYHVFQKNIFLRCYASFTVRSWKILLLKKEFCLFCICIMCISISIYLLEN